MKKIVMILGAVALCCMGLFTSCANDEQDVNIKNWDGVNTGSSYVCDVTDIDIAGIPTTGVTFSVDYGKISWSDNSNTNYKDYELTVNGFKYKEGSREILIGYEGYTSYTIRKIGKEYFVVDDYYGNIDEDVESVTVDPSFESKTFTAKITYKKGEGPMGSDSVSMKFTRK